MKRLASFTHASIFYSFLLVGCNTISPFSQIAYEQATSIKVDALRTMDKANESFLSHQSEVEVIKNNIEKAYEFAKDRPNNIESTKQWELMKDPKKNYIGGFFARWEKDSKLEPKFVNEAKGLISDQFDQIIGLESGKNKSSN